MISRKLIKWLRCDSEVVMNTLVQVLVILERSSAVNKRTYTENASNNRQLKKKSMQVNEGKNLKKKSMKLMRLAHQIIIKKAYISNH